ncbi:MAG: hypothetical protein VB078_07000 [Clostridiaceae bacterium]|nr:hypothetical protein [Clostridiaceae bacterium]
MLKEAIEKITELATPKTYVIGNDTYTTERLERVKPFVARPVELAVSGLDSICKLVRSEIDKIDAIIMIRVSSHDTVDVFTSYLADYVRNNLYTAKADVPGFRAGWRDYEQAVIEIRSLFIPNAGSNYLLDLISRMNKDNSVTSEDNGVTQTVQAKQGIALNTLVQINPRVELTPFRTFLEVDQPSSEYLLRVDDTGKIGLFEADGGVWKLEAKGNVAKYFEASLSDLVEVGKVVVMI